MTKTSFPKDKIRVLLLEKIHPEADRLFAEHGLKVDRIDTALSGDALRKAAAKTHILGIRSASNIRAEDLTQLSTLLTIGCFCIGTNQVDAHQANLLGIPVFNSPFSNTRSVAELTIGQIIALYRGLLVKSRQMHQGVWDKSAAGAHEVRGRTLGIVGYGRIGSQVSILAEALGMRVLFHDIAPVLPLGNARSCRSLHDLLKESDVLSLHVPATRATHNLISDKQLSLLKPGSFVINNARGSVVDLNALALALKSKHLAGAALDVFPDEPSHNGETFHSPIQGLENVILTPHVAGSTLEAQQAIAHDVAMKLLRFINNGSTTGAVNVPQVELPEQGHPHDTDQDRASIPRRHRILHFHRNVPGVLSKMHTIISELGANITSEYLQTNAEVGYVVLDVDPTDAQPIMTRLKEIPETIRLRLLW